MDKLTQAQKRDRFAAMTEAGILHSIRALKGHFTRYTVEAAALMTTLAEAPNVKSLERLERMLDKITEKQQEFDAAQEALGGMDKVNHEEHDKMFDGLAKEYTKQVHNINTAIAKCAVPTPALDTQPRAPAFII